MSWPEAPVTGRIIEYLVDIQTVGFITGPATVSQSPDYLSAGFRFQWAVYYQLSSLVEWIRTRVTRHCYKLLFEAVSMNTSG